jgi:hypothetical protein
MDAAEIVVRNVQRDRRNVVERQALPKTVAELAKYKTVI